MRAGTARALLVGAGFGGLLGLTNLYVGLKTGLAVGVGVTPALLAHGVFRLLAKGGLAAPLTLEESVLAQSAASAAGYAAGRTLVTAVPALMILAASAGEVFVVPWPALVAWSGAVAALGIACVSLLAPRLLDDERLPFPSSAAMAVTLRHLHGEGPATATPRARTFALPLVLAAVASAFRQGARVPGLGRFAVVPDRIAFAGNGAAAGSSFLPLSTWGLGLETSPLLLGAGAFVGLPVTASMVGGAAFVCGVLGASAVAARSVTSDGALVALASAATLWRDVGVFLGAPLLLGAALPSLVASLRRSGAEVGSFRGAGLRRWPLVFGAALTAVLAAHVVLRMPVVLAAASVLLAFPLAFVACRVVGETDVTPTAALAKVTQVGASALASGNAGAGLGAAGIVAGSAAAASDLLIDLRAGRTLGADARRQWMAYAVGIAAGAVVTSLAFAVLVPSVGALLGEGGQPPLFPAPAAQQWATVARVFREGFAGLHPLRRALLVAGLVSGPPLAMAEAALRRRGLRFVPSVTGFALGTMVPPSLSLTMLVGALLGRAAASRGASSSVPSIAAGLMAGESLLGIVTAASVLAGAGR